MRVTPKRVSQPKIGKRICYNIVWYHNYMYKRGEPTRVVPLGFSWVGYLNKTYHVTWVQVVLVMEYLQNSVFRDFSFPFLPKLQPFYADFLKKIDWKIDKYLQQVLEHHQMISLKPLQYFCHLNSPIIYFARSLKTRIDVLYTFNVQKITLGPTKS